MWGRHSCLPILGTFQSPDSASNRQLWSAKLENFATGRLESLPYKFEQHAPRMRPQAITGTLDSCVRTFYFPVMATTAIPEVRPGIHRDEEALDIEWAHAMAPHAKLFLVVSALCQTPQCATDPTWQAVQLAGYLVAQNGGGVVSM